MRLKKAEIELIAFARVCRVSTVDGAGKPHCVPVCPIFDGKRIYFGTDRATKKVGNVRQNSKAALVFDEYSEAWSGLRGVMIQGEARILERGPGFRKIRGLLYKKYPQYERNPEGKYVVHFFSHGLRHLPDEARLRVSSLRPDDTLYLMPDPQNPHDGCALALRTDDPATIVGYCPRYIASDFLEILENDPDAVDVRVKRVNTDAPIQLRLLCTLTADWPENFKPCSSEYYEELGTESETSSTYRASSSQTF